MAADIPPLQSLTTAEQRALLDLLNKARAACTAHDASHHSG